MKRFLVIFCLLLFITGCSNEDDISLEKDEYLAWKSELVDTEEFSDGEDLVCDIDISLSRIDSEIVSYTTVVSNPKVNMNSVKMMVVHNYFTEDIFPTSGIFDESTDLLVDSDGNITLVGYIDTTKDIKSLDLEIKVWIEYTDDEGNVVDIYYKTTE